jgi:hypothetical protein
MTIGLGMGIFGVFRAIYASDPYWYSYFTIGSFLFFDRISALLTSVSTLQEIRNGKWFPIVLIYGIFLLLAVLIDFVYGRFMTHAWVYPHYNLFDEIIHVILIGYPFAFFSTIEMTAVICILLNIIWLKNTKFVNSGKHGGSRIFNFLAKVLFLIGVLAVVYPYINYIFRDNRNVQEIMVICMIASTFLFDAIGYLLRAPSILGAIYQGNWAIILGLVLAVLLSASLHEIPNTYAREWVYVNIPFTDAKIFGVNVIVFFPGWLFLTIFPLSIYGLIGHLYGVSHPLFRISEFKR